MSVRSGAMRAGLIPVVLCMATSACSQEQPSQTTYNTVSSPRPVPSSPPEKVERPSPPPSKESLPEEPFAPTSAQGAATVVETYYGLIEAGKYAEALDLR